VRVVMIAMVAGALLGCSTSSGGRYIVSASPLNLLRTAHPGMCVAVDPSNPAGVWWWEPGKSGCATRSTGPELFPGWKARVSTTSGVTDIRFEVPLMVNDPLQVRLTLDDRRMRYEASGEQVGIERRKNLDVPESCCPQPLTSR